MQTGFRHPVPLSDTSRLVYLKKNPASGPKILFFSGGSALRGVSRGLTTYTHNSIHIITAFDSGGSSAKLREAFHMPAVGDLRARLMDLTDQSFEYSREVYELFAYRFPKPVNNDSLVAELDKMAAGGHQLIVQVPAPMRSIIRNHLSWFSKNMPADFDLRGASIGNLILTAGYLENQRDLDSVICTFSKLIGVKGTVRLVANKYLHLAAELQNDSTVVGQHLLTGKEVTPISSRIEKIFITKDKENPKPYNLELDPKTKDLISNAELISYPMGSFFTSILANFLVTGVGEAVASNNSPKIFIPNSWRDPECFGMSLMDQIEAIVEYGRKDAPDLTAKDLINFVLVDSQQGDYVGGIDETYFTRQGIELIDCQLISGTSQPYIDENLLLPLLLSIAN